MHTHFTQLYIAGNFPYLTNIVRVSGRVGTNTPISPFEPFSIHVVFAISVRVNNPWPNAMFFQFPNVLHPHVLLWKSIQSSAIDYFKSHLLAQHSMNEGESATGLRMIFNSKHYNTQMIHKKICATFTHVLAYKFWKWLNLQKYTMMMLTTFVLCSIDPFQSYEADNQKYH